MAEAKQCSGCGAQPLTNFWRNKSQSDGLQNYCKDCLRRRRQSPEGRKANVTMGRAQRERLRAEMFTAYGSACACCGETGRVFLTLDHIDGLPDAHRRKAKTTGRFNYRKPTHEILRELRRAGWPAGYQILCFNCNYAKHALGACPHQG